MFDFKLTQYQAEFVVSCITIRKVVAVFCRQSGKSESTAKVSIILARMLGETNKPILIFAPTDRQAGLMADKIRETINKMPFITDFHIKRQTQREFYFSNGGTIICETVGDTGESVRGYTAGAIILEEAGSIKDSIIHSVIMPMGATTNPPIIKIGTPRGMNHFYESSRDERYVTHQIAWPRAVEEGIVSQTYVDEMKATLPLDRFKTEMDAEFVADEDAYFGYDLIEKCANIKCPVEEEARGGDYFLGADIARLGQDSTCLMVARLVDGQLDIVKIVDIPKCTLDFVIDRIEALHEKFKFRKIFIDETGLGAGVRDVLARKHNIYKPTGSLTPRNFAEHDRVIGVKFTIQSKIDIFSNLKVLMEQSKVFYPRNEKLIAQLRDFRYETTDSGNVKLHHSEYGNDDYCDALALAVQGMKKRKTVMNFE